MKWIGTHTRSIEQNTVNFGTFYFVNFIIFYLAALRLVSIHEISKTRPKYSLYKITLTKVSLISMSIILNEIRLLYRSTLIAGNFVSSITRLFGRATKWETNGIIFKNRLVDLTHTFAGFQRKDRNAKLWLMQIHKSSNTYNGKTNYVQHRKMSRQTGELVFHCSPSVYCVLRKLTEFASSRSWFEAANRNSLSTELETRFSILYTLERNQTSTKYFSPSLATSNRI